MQSGCNRCIQAIILFQVKKVDSLKLSNSCGAPNEVSLNRTCTSVINCLLQTADYGSASVLYMIVVVTGYQCLCFVLQVLRYFDYFFTTVFTIEIAVKVSAIFQRCFLPFFRENFFACQTYACDIVDIK